MDTRTLVKSVEEIEAMRTAGQKLATVVASFDDLIVPGVRAMQIDQHAEAMIQRMGATPAFKGYDTGGSTPFPGTICFSPNEAIVHGIPTEEYIVRDTDLISIDIGLIYQGYYADMARTYCMSGVSEEARQLSAHTRKTLEAGLATLHDGARLSEYARATQTYTEGKGYKVVKNLVGHGIGRELHMPPQVPNYMSPEFDNFVFRAGMTVALEPMVTIGSEIAVTGPDGWTLVTQDGSLAAHHENTVLITSDGYEILTSA